jgi:hypothetical protein
MTGRKRRYARSADRWSRAHEAFGQWKNLRIVMLAPPPSSRARDALVGTPLFSFFGKLFERR